MKQKTFFSTIFLKLTIIFFNTIILAPVTGYGAPGQWKAVAAHFQEEGKQAVLVRVVEQSGNTIKLLYQTPPLTFRELRYQTIEGKPTEFCEMGNARTCTKPGEPQVPYIFSKIILSQGHTVESITLHAEEKVTLKGKHLLSYGLTPQHCNDRRNIYTKPCTAIYGSDAAFPEKTHELMSVQYRCGVAIAHVKIFPVAYYPKTGTVSYYPSFTLEVTTRKDVSSGTGVRVRADRLLQRSKALEENPSMLQTYTNGIIQGEYRHALCNPRENFRYVIVTDIDIINASTDTSINDLISLREAQGFTCKVQNISEVYSNYPGSSDYEKLRNFIKDAYNNWETEFVLLGGDTRILPSTTVFAQYANESDDIVTDLPFQCLDQATWNDDYEAEVFIGRFSADNDNEFANQVAKTIRYESITEGDSYLKYGIGIGEKLSQSGDPPPYVFAKPCMKELEQFFPYDFSFDELYDMDATWNVSQGISAVNSEKYSIINHFGHSNATYLMKMQTTDVGSYTNKKPIFLKSQGCMCGDFTLVCIAESFTTSYRTGMFSVVLNSNYGWFYNDPDSVTNGSSQQVHKAFWRGRSEGLQYFGELNEYSHSTNPDLAWDILQTNLLGDPAVRFRGMGSKPFIQVVSPNGGEELEQNTTCNVTWSDNISGNVKIELYKGTTVYKELAQSTASDGAHEWAITDSIEAGDDYKIRVTNVDSTALYSESVAPFSIIEELIFTLPYKQDFNNWSEQVRGTEYWEQSSTDSIDWTIQSGPTPSRAGGSATGAEGDYPDGLGKYIYVEASGVDNNPSKEASIITPKFDFRNVTDATLSLYYHMYSGENAMGDFFVDVRVGESGNWELAKISLTDNDYGDQWIEATLDMDFIISGSYTDEQKKRVRIRLRGITSDDPQNAWSSDICIDEFELDATGTEIVYVPSLLKNELSFSNARIRYAISENNVPVTVTLYHLNGKLIRTLVNKVHNAGTYYVNLGAGRQIAEGVYICRLKTPGFQKVAKIIKR